MVSSVLALISLLMTWRTAPWFFLTTQVLQTPMRQPNSGLSPAASACSRIVWPLFATSILELSRVSEPVASGASRSTLGTLKYSMRSCSVAPSSS